MWGGTERREHNAPKGALCFSIFSEIDKAHQVDCTTGGRWCQVVGVLDKVEGVMVYSTWFRNNLLVSLSLHPLDKGRGGMVL